MEAGCDEAGRGCLAGPVVAAAVIFPPDYSNSRLDDSKKLSVKTRDVLRKEIERDALSYAVAFIDHLTIDQINILKASIKAMHEALNNLSVLPQHIIIDGNKFFPYKKIPFQCIVKGDSKYMSIAAASILAKTWRDEYMVELSNSHPHYGWDQNMGYPTKKHREALRKFGPSEFHRRSFQLIDKQLDLKFYF
jgi:ribonuclease HII